MKDDNFLGTDWESAQKEIDKHRMLTDPLWPERKENPNYKFTLGKFAEGRENKLPLHEDPGFFRSYYPSRLPDGVSYEYTRFQNDNLSELYKHFLMWFIYWSDSLKGRLPVPPYDIADPRIDEEKEEEFFNLVRKNVYDSLIQDAEKFAKPGEKTSYDENSMKYLSFSIALVLCAYYHHSFDPVIANESFS